MMRFLVVAAGCGASAAGCGPSSHGLPHPMAHALGASSEGFLNLAEMDQRAQISAHSSYDGYNANDLRNCDLSTYWSSTWGTSVNLTLTFPQPTTIDALSIVGWRYKYFQSMDFRLQASDGGRSMWNISMHCEKKEGRFANFSFPPATAREFLIYVTKPVKGYFEFSCLRLRGAAPAPPTPLSTLPPECREEGFLELPEGVTIKLEHPKGGFHAPQLLDCKTWETAPRTQMNFTITFPVRVTIDGISIRSKVTGRFFMTLMASNGTAWTSVSIPCQHVDVMSATVSFLPVTALVFKLRIHPGPASVSGPLRNHNRYYCVKFRPTMPDGTAVTTTTTTTTTHLNSGPWLRREGLVESCYAWSCTCDGIRRLYGVNPETSDGVVPLALRWWRLEKCLFVSCGQRHVYDCTQCIANDDAHPKHGPRCAGDCVTDGRSCTANLCSTGDSMEMSIVEFSDATNLTDHPNSVDGPWSGKGDKWCEFGEKKQRLAPGKTISVDISDASERISLVCYAAHRGWNFTAVTNLFVPRDIQRDRPVTYQTEFAAHTITVMAKCAGSQVSCGRHRASRCDLCTVGHGKEWCNGECYWNGFSCELDVCSRGNEILLTNIRFAGNASTTENPTRSFLNSSCQFLLGDKVVPANLARPQFAQSSEDDDTVIVVSDNELPISVRCRDDLGELGNVKLFAPKNLLHHKKESYARSFTADDNGIQLRLDATCDGKNGVEVPGSCLRRDGTPPRASAFIGTSLSKFQCRAACLEASSAATATACEWGSEFGSCVLHHAESIARHNAARSDGTFCFVYGVSCGVGSAYRCDLCPNMDSDGSCFGDCEWDGHFCTQKP